MASLNEAYGDFPGTEPGNQSTTLLPNSLSSSEYIGKPIRNGEPKQPSTNPMEIEPNMNCNGCRKDKGLNTFVKTKIYTCKYHYVAETSK